MAGGSCSSFAGLFGLELLGSVCLRIKAGRHSFDGPPLPGLPLTSNIYIFMRNFICTQKKVEETFMIYRIFAFHFSWVH